MAVQNDSGSVAIVQMAELDPESGPGSPIGDAVAVQAGGPHTVRLPIPEQEPWIVLIDGEGVGSLHSIGLADAARELPANEALQIDVHLLPDGQTNISIGR